MTDATFGRRLRTLRLQRGLTQEEVAGGEISTSYVSLLESGKRAPTADVVVKIAAQLNVAPEFLLGQRAEADLPDEDTRGDTAAELRLRLATADLLAGDADAALAGFSAVHAEAVDRHHRRSALLGMAAAAEALGSFDTAEKHYTDWFEQAGEPAEPDQRPDGWVPASLGLCRVLRELGRPDQALAAGERGLAAPDVADPEFLELAATVTELRQELGGPAEPPTATFEAARELATARARGDRYREAGRAARDEGRTTSALALARQAVIEYGHERTKARLAVVQAAHAYERFRVEGAGEEVLELMRSALADLGVPGAETVRAAYTAKHSRMLLSAGRLEAAEEAARVAGALCPLSGLTARNARLTLAEVLWELGEHPEAARIQEEVAESDVEEGRPNDAAKVLFGLADGYERAGDTAAALQTYRRATAVLNLTA
ncbi:helix-turn-helix domain-containing protein [Amycolatopsis sp. NPDC021455]|uniref:helix-turn-helix domain-containing protein n=1 Tax=Amycolatopsis sp. NPDC021455 TaxID=3154901 RepID=UPI0033EDCD68